MASLSELIAARDALIASRGRPERTVEYDGKSVTYKSDGELAAAIADLDRRIAEIETGGRVKTVLIASSKGV
ncbi:MAG: hypothetical protein WD076_09815 [Parvularculaceae bacterium]